jgi:hypothetical protein
VSAVRLGLDEVGRTAFTRCPECVELAAQRLVDQAGLCVQQLPIARSTPCMNLFSQLRPIFHGDTPIIQHPAIEGYRPIEELLKGAERGRRPDGGGPGRAAQRIGDVAGDGDVDPGEPFSQRYEVDGGEDPGGPGTADIFSRLAMPFWALLKEEISSRIWPDRATGRAEVFAFVETFDNRRCLRKHKVFGYLTPAETRQRHQHGLAA